MRLVSKLPLIAVLALIPPAFAQDAAPPDPGEAPAAGATAPKVRTPNPEGVSDAADKTLWCGHAFVQVSDQVKASGDVEGGETMLKDGNTLIEKGTGMLSEAGFDDTRIATTKAAYLSEVETELAGDAANARYAYDECLVLTPAGAALLGAPPPEDEN